MCIRIREVRIVIRGSGSVQKSNGSGTLETEKNELTEFMQVFIYNLEKFLVGLSKHFVNLHCLGCNLEHEQVYLCAKVSIILSIF